MQQRGLKTAAIKGNDLISACEKAQSPTRAFQGFEGTQQGLMPDVITNKALTSACEKAHDPARAFQGFEGMQ